MNWLQKIAQLPQMSPPGSNNRASEIIPLVANGQMDANEAAKQLMNEREICCQTLGEILSNDPDNQNLRALQNALKCFDTSSEQKAMQTQNLNMQNPNMYPAGTVFPELSEEGAKNV